MVFNMNWNASIDGISPSYPWSGTVSGDAVGRISKQIPPGETITISLQALPAPPLRALLVSASRYQDTRWALDGLPAVSIEGPLILNHDTGRLFNAPPPGSLMVTNNGAEDLFVEIGLIRDA